MTYTPKRLPGYHDVDPNNPMQGFLAPGAGKMKPFSMSSEEIIEMKAPAPPGMKGSFFQPNDPEYVASLEQVRARRHS